MAWASMKHETQVLRALKQQRVGSDSSATLRALQTEDERAGSDNEDHSRKMKYLPRFGFVQHSSRLGLNYFNYLETRVEQEDQGQ